MGLSSVSSTISCSSRAMEGADGRAFGRVAADHAVPVLVAAAPPRAVRVGEIRGHARFVAQLGVPGELGAVVMRHSGAGGGRQPGEHGLLRRHARGGGLVGHDLRPWGNGRAARPRCAGCGPAPMTPSASRSPKRLPSSCPHGRSQIDVRKRDAAAARPRTRPEPPGPARPVRFALAGREPRVASDLPAGRGRMPSRHHGHAAHARPVAHPNPDDLPSLFRQVRIHLAQGATPLRLAIRTISNLTGAALSIRQRAKEQKTFICGGRLAYVFLGKKKSPAAMQGFSNEVIREEENDPV